MEDKTKVLESQITASSGIAKRGRLNNWKGWAPTNSDSREWLAVRFPNNTNITAVATQGARNPIGFVQKYKVEYSTDCIVWTEYAGPGNEKVLEGNQNNPYQQDKNSIVKNQMEPPFIAKCIRIRPQNWSYRIGLRMELYGCTVNGHWSPFAQP